MSPLVVRPESPQDGPRIERLLDESFGKDRQNRGVYALRAPQRHIRSLAYVGVDTTGQIQGTLRFWPLQIDEQQADQEGDPAAVLLGPIAIAQAHQGKGYAAILINRGLSDAAALGYGLCFLVTDTPQVYRRYAFTNAQGRFSLPVDLGPKKSFLLMELKRGALSLWPTGAALGAAA